MIQYLETCSPIFHSVSCWRSQAGIFLKKKKKKKQTPKDEIIPKGRMGSLYWRKLGRVGGEWSLKFKRGVAFIWHITSLNSEFIFSQVQKRRGTYLTCHQSEQWIYYPSSSKEAWCLSDISPQSEQWIYSKFKRGMVLSDTSPESKQGIYYLSSSKEEWCYLTNHQSLNSEFIISLVLKRECVYLTYYQSLISGIFGLAVWHLFFVNAAYTYAFSLQIILPSLFLYFGRSKANFSSTLVLGEITQSSIHYHSPSVCGWGKVPNFLYTTILWVCVDGGRVPKFL